MHAKSILYFMWAATGRKPAFPPSDVHQFGPPATIPAGYCLPGEEMAQVGAFGTISQSIEPLKRSSLGLAWFCSLVSGVNYG